MTHTKDSDCTVDPETDCCSVCGVWHGDPCPLCHGQGFHEDACEHERNGDDYCPADLDDLIEDEVAGNGMGSNVATDLRRIKAEADDARALITKLRNEILDRMDSQTALRAALEEARDSLLCECNVDPAPCTEESLCRMCEARHNASKALGAL